MPILAGAELSSLDAWSLEYHTLLFIPLSDDNPLRFVRYQWVTIGIIAVNVSVFVLQICGLSLATGTSLAVVPAELLQVRFVHARHLP